MRESAYKSLIEDLIGYDRIFIQAPKPTLSKDFNAQETFGMVVPNDPDEL